MSTAAEHLTRAADGLRADVRYLQQRRAEGKTLTADQQQALAVKALAADLVDQVANERLDSVRLEAAPLLAKVANDNWGRGRRVGLADAVRILEVKAQVARPWQRRALQAAATAVNRLADQLADERAKP